MDYRTGEAEYGGEPAHALPSTTDQARDAVERTRGRISETLDQIEGQLVSRKERIKARADVARPVRDQVSTRPLRTVGLALGAGLLIGLATGREEEELDVPDERERRRIRARRRARRAEARMRTRLEEAEALDRQERGVRRPGRGAVSSTARELGRTAMHQLGGALTGALTSAVYQRLSGGQASARSTGSRGHSPEAGRTGRDTGIHS